MTKTWNETAGCYDIRTTSREVEVMTRAIAEAMLDLQCAFRWHGGGPTFRVDEADVGRATNRVMAALDAAGFSAEGGLR